MKQLRYKGYTGTAAKNVPAKYLYGKNDNTFIESDTLKETIDNYMIKQKRNQKESERLSNLNKKVCKHMANKFKENKKRAWSDYGNHVVVRLGNQTHGMDVNVAKNLLTTLSDAIHKATGENSFHGKIPLDNGNDKFDYLAMKKAVDQCMYGDKTTKPEKYNNWLRLKEMIKKQNFPLWGIIENARYVMTDKKEVVIKLKQINGIIFGYSMILQFKRILNEDIKFIWGKDAKGFRLLIESDKNTKKKEIEEYRGYTGTIERDPWYGTFYGEILCIDESIYYKGDTISKLKDAFKDAVDLYIRKNIRKKTVKMSNKSFLQWLHDRIVCQYNEKKDTDFLIRFRSIINNNVIEQSTNDKLDSLIYDLQNRQGQSPTKQPTNNKLINFIYLLCRDNLPFGDIEENVEHIEKSKIGLESPNKYMIEYARTIAKRLTRE